MADEPDDPLVAPSLPTIERQSSRCSADTATCPNLSGLTAADAEWFDGLAAAKREGAEGCSDPATRAEYEAEAAGLEALVARLRDPAAHGVPRPLSGQGGETAPPDNPDMPWRYREVAQAVAARPGMLAADASLARLGLARDANVLTMAVETAQDARRKYRNREDAGTPACSRASPRNGTACTGVGRGTQVPTGTAPQHRRAG